MSKLLKIFTGLIIFIIIAIITIYFIIFNILHHTVKGIIRDSINNKPVAGVEVVIDQNIHITIDDGVYEFKNIKYGSYILSARKAGYKKYSRMINVEGDIKIDILIYQTELKQ